MHRSQMRYDRANRRWRDLCQRLAAVTSLATLLNGGNETGRVRRVGTRVMTFGAAAQAIQRTIRDRARNLSGFDR